MQADKMYNTQWDRLDIEKASRDFDVMLAYLPRDVKSVLDIGGGPGAMYESLQRSAIADATYCLLDSSSAGVDRAKGRGIRAVLHDLDRDERLPFEDNSFDCVCLIDVLEHLRNPWATLREASRVSRRYVFVHGPNFAYWRSRMQVLAGLPHMQMVVNRYGDVVDERGRASGHIYYMTYSNLIHHARAFGLNVKKQRVFWYRRYMPLRWLLEACFKNFGSQYQVVFETHI